MEHRANSDAERTSTASPRILFVHNLKCPLDEYPAKGSFVYQDLKTLEKHFHVTEYNYCRPQDKWRFAIWLLKNRKKYDLCYFWFGDFHATIGVAIGKLLGKKSIIVAGGYDTRYVPEIRYGFFSKPQRYLYGWLHYSLADAVIACGPSLKRSIIDKVNISGEKIVTLLLGLDGQYWKCIGGQRNGVITVGLVNDEKRARLKGITTVLELANRIPEIKFIIVGIGEPYLSQISGKLPENVRVYPPVGKEELRDLYCRSRVYLQLSLSEALSSALCESMLCGCVPVGTNVGDIPVSIGDCGYIVPYGNLDAVADALQKANASDNDSGKKARDRILRIMSPELRERRICEIVRKVMNSEKINASDYETQH